MKSLSRTVTASSRRRLSKIKTKDGVVDDNLSLGDTSRTLTSYDDSSRTLTSYDDSFSSGEEVRSFPLSALVSRKKRGSSSSHSARENGTASFVQKFEAVEESSSDENDKDSSTCSTSERNLIDSSDFEPSDSPQTSKHRTRRRAKRLFRKLGGSEELPSTKLEGKLKSLPADDNDDQFENIWKLEEKNQDLQKQMHFMRSAISVTDACVSSIEASVDEHSIESHNRAKRSSFPASSYSKRVYRRASEVSEMIRLASNRDLTRYERMNKLRSDSIGLVGREHETETLKNCLARLTLAQDTNRRKELVFIKGNSGVGKTSLASTMESSISKNKEAVLGHGKFDQTAKDRSYYGLAAAFGEICRAVENKREKFIRNIRQAILSELGGSEVELLVKLIPELAGLFPAHRYSSNREIDSYNFDAEHERWKYAFRVLTRVLSSYFSPLILILDDLQWADSASLEVIEYLITDTQNTNSLMIVGCYRSNEFDDSLLLSPKLRELKDKKRKFNFNMTNIELKRLGIGKVRKIIMALLWTEDEVRTHSLAKICYQRTRGNPFFLIEFVTMLEEIGLVTFDLERLQWAWDYELIEDATMSTSNVVDLLQARMKKLSDNLQLLLQYAACLGSSFRLSALDPLWTKHVSDGTCGAQRENLPYFLTLLEEGNFIESCEGKRHLYKFTHEKVQEAAMLLGNAKKASFQFDIGTILYHELSEKDLEDLLFDVADLINKGKVKRRQELAELNLSAAEKARSISAFESAAIYVANGIELLPSDMWTEHRCLTLRLYTLGVEMALALGRFEIMEDYSAEVLAQQDCSILEKLPIYNAKIYKLSTIDFKWEDTIVLCLLVLTELGCKLVSNRAMMIQVSAASSLKRTIGKVKKTTRAEYDALEPMIDPMQKAIMSVLYRVVIASYESMNFHLLTLANVQIVQLTLKYGVSCVSSSSFGNLGCMLILNDAKTASYFAEIAMLLQGKVCSKDTEANTIFHVNSLVLPWTKPLQLCLDSSSESFPAGMRSGNTEHACWGLLLNHLQLPYVMGKPLKEILKKCPNGLSQIEELNMRDQEVLFRMQWQMMLNLAEQSSSDPTRLDGEIFSFKRFEDDSQFQKDTFDVFQMQLFVFFGDWESGAELALRCGENFANNSPGYFLNMIETFHRGVALYAMARRTKKRKYKKEASKILKTVNGWVQRGDPNVKHYHYFLCAEQSALDRKTGPARGFYDEAIRLATAGGYLQDAALFQERFGDFCLRDLKNESEAKYCIEEAVRLYNAWGAQRKANMLTNSYKRPSQQETATEVLSA